MHTEGAGIAAFVATVKYPHLPESVQGTLHPCPRSGGTCLPSKRCDAMPGLLWRHSCLRTWCNTCTSEIIEDHAVSQERMWIPRFDPFCRASYDSLAGFHLQGDACLQDVCGKGLHMVDGTCFENLCFCPFGAEATGFPIADNYADHAPSKRLYWTLNRILSKDFGGKTRQMALQMSWSSGMFFRWYCLTLRTQMSSWRQHRVW